MQQMSRGLACVALALGLAWPLMATAQDDDTRGGGTGGGPPAEGQGTEDGKTADASAEAGDEADVEAHRDAFTERTYEAHDTQPSEAKNGEAQ
ncbi:hypothetical protein [Chromohalobacter israelensis]|uniref:hypothetical protein n=1 Tax=Chromohalobacter israelensis TaxID=141390 RepID=UPI0005532495|nr:hypothetical protein [Chromohalobacter israelensis]